MSTEYEATKRLPTTTEREKELQIGLEILNFIQKDLYLECKEVPLGMFRGIISLNTQEPGPTFTLSINQDSSSSERLYTGLLAYSSLLVGLGLNLVGTEETILFPQPSKQIIDYLDENQVESQLYSLLMAENLLSQLRPSDWDSELIEKQRPFWHSRAGEKAELLYSHFQDPIFQNNILPRLDRYHEADLQAIDSD